MQQQNLPANLHNMQHQPIKKKGDLDNARAGWDKEMADDSIPIDVNPGTYYGEPNFQNKEAPGLGGDRATESLGGTTTGEGGANMGGGTRGATGNMKSRD